MSQRRLYLAAYDISSPKRLQRALRVLKGYASGGQKSVFECYLNASEKKDLIAEVKERINTDQDRFFLITLGASSQVRTLGVGLPPVDPDYAYLG